MGYHQRKLIDMEWYLPMTIIPGIGLIILSTSNLMLTLNAEITQLVNNQTASREVVKLKLTQLKNLSISIVFQYIGVMFFLFSGIFKSIFSDSNTIPKGLLSIGVGVVSISIIILLIYSIRAVSIRQKHLSSPLERG